MPRRGTPTDIPGVTRDGAKWIVRVVLMDQTGRRCERQKVIRNAIDGDALKAAVARLRGELKAEIEGGPDKSETVDAFATLWLEQSAATGRARRYVVNGRKQQMQRFVSPYLGGRELRTLRRSDVVAWMTTIATRRRPHGMLYSRRTLMSAWATLRAMLKRAVIMRDLDCDPTNGVRFEIGDHVDGEQRPEPEAKDTLTRDELARVLDSAKAESSDVRAMIIVQVATGLRFCEVSALEWQDVDLDEGRLKIRRSQVGGAVGPPKTEVTRRNVYLSPAIVEVLREHRRWQVQEQVAGLSKGLVFPSNTGGYRRPALFKKPLARCCKLAGVEKHISSHSLRKTANNLLRQANAGDAVVRAMIGHATSEMTRLYSNVGDDEKARAHVAAFGEVFDLAVGRNVGVERSPTTESRSEVGVSVPEPARS